MAADYSKACDHERVEIGPLSGKPVCLDCGRTLVVTVDTSELGPVKLGYATAVSDARVLNWRQVPVSGPLSMPPDKAFYVAWQELPWGAAARRWRIERVEVGQKLPGLAQWWADDLLGLPPCND